MATCRVSDPAAPHSSVISSRLSRLFSVFVLPSLSGAVLFSIHSPRLKTWLRNIALMQDSDDMVRCIISATQSLYHAVRDLFQPTQQRPHYIFSNHDLQKVFRGMLLWQPNIPSLKAPKTTVWNIVDLWMHECMRTFSDRLHSEEESKALVSLIAETASTHYRVPSVHQTRPVCEDDPPTVQNTSRPADQSEDTPQRPQRHLEDIAARLVYGPDFSEALKSVHHQQNVGCCSSYHNQDIETLLQDLGSLIDRKDEEEGQRNDGCARLVMHRQRAGQLLHILRVLLIPGGHGLLIGSDKGTGRKTTVRLAACVSGSQLVEVHPGNENKLHEILKEAGSQTRVDEARVIVLVHEGISQTAREELLLAMAHNTYPGLHTDHELRDLVSRATTVRGSRRYLQDSSMFEK